MDKNELAALGLTEEEVNAPEAVLDHARAADPLALIDSIPPHGHIADLITGIRESDSECRARQKRWAGDAYKIWLVEGETVAREWQRKYIDALLYDARHDSSFSSAVYWCYAPTTMRKYETALADPRTSDAERRVAEQMLAAQAERRAVVEHFERFQKQ